MKEERGKRKDERGKMNRRCGGKEGLFLVTTNSARAESKIFVVILSEA